MKIGDRKTVVLIAIAALMFMSLVGLVGCGPASVTAEMQFWLVDN